MNKKPQQPNWQTKKLGEICDLQNCYAFSSKDYVEGSNTMNFRMSQIRPDGSVDLDNNPKYLPDSYAKVYKDFLLKDGDIVIAMTDMATETKILGVPTIVKTDDRNLLLNQRVGKLYNLNERTVCIPFLKYVLNSQQVNQYYKSLGRGGLQINISKQDILNVEIPLPPIAEQKRIVKNLDGVFEGISKARENTEKNLKNTREFFESYLQSVFVNPKKDWEEKKLGDEKLLEMIDGDRGKNYPKKSDFLDKGHCLFLNTKNVRQYGFDFKTTMFISQQKDSLLRKGKLQRNDVVMTTRGTIGNLGLYSDGVKYNNIRINSGMLIFRPNTKAILPEYLFKILYSDITKTQINRHVSGAAQPQLPIKTLVNFIIPVPKSLHEQKQIVKKLDALSEETKKLEKIYQKKLDDLDELKKSILKKVFSGEL